MKLYDGGRAPNPRRTRIFLAEKDITVPTEQVDLGAMAHMSAAYAAINPLKRLPALVLDDGTVITESIAICRYFEALKPDPPLFGRGALELARIEMWNRRLELHLLFPVSHVFRNSHPAMKEMEVPQVPAWAEANKPRIQEFIAVLDDELKDRPFVAGDAFSVADITGLVAVDFMKPGGRFNTCFFLETAKGTLLVDFGASSLVALKARGLDPDRIDGIVLSHLHGDHFGALPFLLLDAQFLARRERPLLIAGPPGTRARLDQLLEVFFPRSTTNKWRFSWNVIEIEVGRPTDVLGHSVTTTEVLHYSGAPSTAIVLSDGEKRFAYSGDTEWVEALVSVADGADFFIIECFAYSGELPGHLTWDVLKKRLPDLRARRIMLTHMNPVMLAHLDEVRAAGVLVAEDGVVIDI